MQKLDSRQKHRKKTDAKCDAHRKQKKTGRHKPHSHGRHHHPPPPRPQPPLPQSCKTNASLSWHVQKVDSWQNPAKTEENTEQKRCEMESSAFFLYSVARRLSHYFASKNRCENKTQVQFRGSTAHASKEIAPPRAAADARAANNNSSSSHRHRRGSGEWWSSLSKKCSSSRELSRYFRICSPAWPYHDFQEAHRRTELSCHRQRQWETAWATTFWMHAGGQKSLQKDLDVLHDDFTAVRPAASMKDVKCARPNLLVCLRLARPPRDVSAT